MWALLKEAILIICRLLSPAHSSIALWEVVNLSPVQGASRRVCVCVVSVVNVCPVFGEGLAVKYLAPSPWRDTLISLIALFDDSNAGVIAKQPPLITQTLM